MKHNKSEPQVDTTPAKEYNRKGISNTKNSPPQHQQQQQPHQPQQQVSTKTLSQD